MPKRQHKRDTKAIRPHIERLIHDVLSDETYELSPDRVRTVRLALAAVDVLHKLEDNIVIKYREPEQLALGLDISQDQVLAIRQRGEKLAKRD